MTVRKGWHIYANPPGADHLKPTTVVLSKDQPARLIRVTYPEGESKVLASSGDEKVSVYEGQCSLTARLRLAEDVKTIPEALEFTVRYQACNDRACLAPATLTVPASLVMKP